MSNSIWSFIYLLSNITKKGAIFPLHAAKSCKYIISMAFLIFCYMALRNTWPDPQVSRNKQNERGCIGKGSRKKWDQDYSVICLWSDHPEYTRSRLILITQSSPLVWKNYEHVSISGQLYKVLSCNDLESHETQCRVSREVFSIPIYTGEKSENLSHVMVIYTPKHRVQARCGPHLSLFQKLQEDLPGSGFLAKLHILSNYKNPGYANSPGYAPLLPSDPLPAHY